MLDVGTAFKSENTTSACDFVVDVTDKDGDCPSLDGVDEVGYTTDTTGDTTSESTDEGGPIIPDLPKAP